MERSCQKLSADGISSLPGGIIDSILSRLTLHEAVRTSILSTEWRYKWTSFPNLVFDMQTFPLSEFVNIINHVLHNHRGPIHKFYLSCRSSQDIDQWILILSSSQVQDFTLSILIQSDKHVLTPPFFSFQYLKHLHLDRCVFKPPPEFKGFTKLITLYFSEVDFVPAIFQQFISQSPLLETVNLHRCTELDAFEVQGPSLRVFKFYGVFKTICFKKSPVLIEISLLYIPTHGNLEIQSSTGFKYFQIPLTLEKLRLNPCLLEFSGAGGVPWRFADSLNSLKVLDLGMYMDSINGVACALCLARSSPNLQTLSITLYNNDRTEDAITEFIRTQETPDPYVHQQLKWVYIDAPRFGSEPEIELLRYFLASATGLQKINVKAYAVPIYHDTPLSHNQMNRLKQFPRASPTALVYVSWRQKCLCF